MEVVVEGASYLVQTKKSAWDSPANVFSPQERILLLNNINLYLKSGSITCFLGTGDGQKRLLELMALKQTEGYMSGNILHDNVIRPNGNYKDIAYITRDSNTYYEGLKVFDYLYFGARLRLTFTQIETREKIREVIKLVGLDGGLKINRLRKGEMVMLAIALELVNSPTLLILESPIQSLEYGEALEVVRGLKRISRRKTHPITVIFIAEGVNQDMLRLVDNISIFTSMRMSFNISLFEYNANSGIDVAAAAPSLSDLYVLIAEASAELLRRPKHLQTTVVEDNLLKVCTDLNTLKDTVEDELLVAHHGRRSGGSQGSRGRDSGSGMPPSLPSINVTGQPRSRGSSDVFDANYISMSPMSADLTRTPSSTLPSRPSVNPNDVQPDLNQFYRTDSFTATTLRNQQNRGTSGDAVVNKKRTFKPVLQELEVLMSREFMFILSNMFQIRMSLGRFFLIGFVLGAYTFNQFERIDGADDDLISSEYGVINSFTYNITSVMYSMVFTILLGIAPSVGHLHTYCRILKQEVIAGYVRESSCWISTLLFNLPIYIAAVALMGMIIWFFMGIHGGSDNFFGLLILGVMASYSLAAVCAAWCSTGYIATRVYILVCAVFMGVCGYLRYINDMPAAYGVLTASAFSRFVYEGLMVATFRGLGASGQEYLESMNFDNHSVSYCINTLIFWVGMLQLLFLAGLTPPSYKLVKIQNLIEKIDHRIKGRGTDVGGLSPIKSGGGAVAATNTESLLEAGHLSPSVHKQDEGIMGPVDHYIPPMAITQNLQAKNYAESSGINTGKRLAVKPLQVEDNPFRKVDVKPALRTLMTFSRIKYTNNDEDQPDTVVQGVSGVVAPGETCCILDGNKEGAGSILLRVISGRASAAGVISGVVKANGTQLVAGYALVYSAFVGRGDSAHVPQLTVRQTLHYAAMLRRTDTRSCPSLRHFFTGVLDSSGGSITGGAANFISSSEIEERIGSSADLDARVEEVLLMMGLETVANTVVGQPGLRNLSPSQLRCLTIAVEIVNRPSVIFMDDPTYLLDWHHASVVSNAIKTLAAGGRTVICSISKPTTGVFASFNKCILLASSHMIYFGATDQASAHFENIGFDNRSRDGSSALVNPAEFILDIAADQGIMRPGAGNDGGSSKRFAGNSAVSALSALDLADLCRSMIHASGGINSAEKDTSGSAIAAHLNANMKTKRGTTGGKDATSNPILQSSFIGMRGADQVNDAGGGKAPGLIRLSTAKTSAVIGRQPSLPPIGPTSRVMIARTLMSLLGEPWLVTLYLSRYLITGLLLGTIFWNLNTGSYLERMALFASTFIIVSVIMVDQMDGIHTRKSAFLRERASRASTGFSYWVADSIPFVWLNFLGGMLFCVPVYLIPVCNPTVVNFSIFVGYVLAAIWCNLGLIYLVCMLTPDSVRSRLVYSGILIPAQLFLSGYLLISSTVPVWTSYFAFVSPMGYFMAGCFRNEFEDNNAALAPDVTYGDLEDLYDYHATTLQAFAGLVIIGVIYRLFWLIVLKLWEAMKRRENLRKYDFARKRLRVLLTAGVDWRDYKFSRSSNNSNKTMEEDILAEIDGNNYQPFN